jgi:hypothetical protein
VAIFVLAFASAPLTAGAQLTPDVDLEPGTPLVIYRRDAQLREAVFESAEPSVLRVRDGCPACAGVTAIPWTDLSRVDALVAGQSSLGRILVGGLAGGTGTVVLLAIAGATTQAIAPCHWEHGSCPVFGIALAAPAVISAGIVVGAVMAHRRRPKRWVKVWDFEGRSRGVLAVPPTY